MISRYAAGFRTEPKVAVRGTVHRAEAVGGEPGRCALVEDGKADAVKTREAVEGRDPEIAVRGLVNAADDILRESIVSGKCVNAILRPNGNCDQKDKKEEDKEDAPLVLELYTGGARLVLCRLWTAECHRRSFFLAGRSAFLIQRQDSTLWMIERKRLVASRADPCGTTWLVCSNLYMFVKPPAVCWICFSLSCLLLQRVLNVVAAMSCPASAAVGSARPRIDVPQTSWLGSCLENLI
jgi:hypothetical protein